MQERCKRLCGEDRENCFISNRKQLLCLTDMVINKITGISALFQILRGKIEDGKAIEFIEKANRDMQALVDWVRFLEISGDLREFFQSRPVDREAERRSEPRFPVTQTLKEMIRLEIEIDGTLRTVDTLNLSNRGILFRSPWVMETGTVIMARLVFVRNPLRERTFHLHVRHSRPQSGAFITGCELSPEETESFGIFRSIYEYIEDEVFRQALRDD